MRSKIAQYGKGSATAAYRKLANRDGRLAVDLRLLDLKRREKGPQ